MSHLHEHNIQEGNEYKAPSANEFEELKRMYEQLLKNLEELCGDCEKQEDVKNSLYGANWRNQPKENDLPTEKARDAYRVWKKKNEHTEEEKKEKIKEMQIAIVHDLFTDVFEDGIVQRKENMSPLDLFEANDTKFLSKTDKFHQYYITTYRGKHQNVFKNVFDNFVELNIKKYIERINDELEIQEKEKQVIPENNNNDNTDNTYNTGNNGGKRRTRRNKKKSKKTKKGKTTKKSKRKPRGSRRKR